MRPLRMLCLHGYHGAAAILRYQMQPLIAGTASLVEYVHADAPSLADGDFGWWHAAEDGEYRGWSRTRDWIRSMFVLHGHFDGVFGFSQGAALAGLLVGMRSELAFDFAVLVGGFASKDPRHARHYAARAAYTLPSLHLIGRSDAVVPPIESLNLASRFATPTIVCHDGGHVIAATPDVRRRYRRFLDEMLAQRDSTHYHPGANQ